MCPACLMCTMCTKCTLACRGGEECRFVSRLPRERRHAACVDVKRRLHGAWWRAPLVLPVEERVYGHTAFIIDTLPSVRSPLVRVPTLRHALRMPMCPCGFLSGCHLCAVWVPPSPRVRCRKACITLPYLIHYTVRRAERRLPTATRSTVPAVDSRARGWT